MKYWKKPEAISQEFVANEYVSACVTITCDFDEAYIPPYGYGLAVPESAVNAGVSDNHVYFPCNHEYDVNVDSLVLCEFTHTTEGPENIALGKSYPAYYWLDTKADGSTDFHAVKISTVKNAAESSKS